MKIGDILQSVLKGYLPESAKSFAENELGMRLRRIYPGAIKSILSEDGDRYVVKGSAGNGNWAKCPWIAIFDSLVTTSAETGYYLVYLFKSDMSGVYLSLNQGVTDVKENYKRDAKDVLVTRANDFRDKLEYGSDDAIKIHLVSHNVLPRMYERGNILACYYDTNNMPDELVLVRDLERFLDYYKALVYSDCSTDVIDLDLAKTVEERKQRKLHEKFDRRGDVSLKVKRAKGYKCEACGFVFEEKYGKLGVRFIEAHHLIPFSSLGEGKIKLSIEKDFAVLCSNCHRMIHRLTDPSKVNELKDIIKRLEN